MVRLPVFQLPRCDMLPRSSFKSQAQDPSRRVCTQLQLMQSIASRTSPRFSATSFCQTREIQHLQLANVVKSRSFSLSTKMVCCNSLLANRSSLATKNLPLLNTSTYRSKYRLQKLGRKAMHLERSRYATSNAFIRIQQTDSAAQGAIGQILGSANREVAEL